MSYVEQARIARPLIEKGVQSLSKSEALKVKKLHPHWGKLVKLGQVDTNGEPGYRFYYEGDGELYECVKGDPTFQADWIPGHENGTAALYVRVDEEHAGTQEDPIPADRGMVYTYGLYYEDPEDGKVYRCARAGATEGETITLQYLPHELVGQYFEEA